jgi:hypothetical protein
MVDRRNYVGAMWEQMNPSGIPVIPAGFGNHPDGVSLAHGWSTGPTWQMSQYVLGVAPVDAGYRTWVVAPHPGTLRWARGGRCPRRTGRSGSAGPSGPTASSTSTSTPRAGHPARSGYPQRTVTLARTYD